MIYGADKLGVDRHTQTDTHRQTDASNDNTQGQNWPRVKMKFMNTLSNWHNTYTFDHFKKRGIKANLDFQAKEMGPTNIGEFCIFP